MNNKFDRVLGAVISVLGLVTVTFVKDNILGSVFGWAGIFLGIYLLLRSLNA